MVCFVGVINIIVGSIFDKKRNQNKLSLNIFILYYI